MRDAQLFLKRLRAVLAPEKVRYFIVGEYGSHTARPHYHVALFGVSDADAVRSCWRKGFVHVGSLTPESCSYLTGYTTKGWTRHSYPELHGRVPEFCRMSLKPGIGADAISEMAKGLVSRSGSAAVARFGDVCRDFRFRGRRWPLGRYLVRLLREAVGVSADVSRDAYEVELQLRQLEGHAGVSDRDRLRAQSDARARALIQIQDSRKGVGL